TSIQRLLQLPLREEKTSRGLPPATPHTGTSRSQSASVLPLTNSHLAWEASSGVSTLANQATTAFDPVNLPDRHEDRPHPPDRYSIEQAGARNLDDSCSHESRTPRLGL